jgi:SAM-dependent methyltransferase
MTAVAKVKSRVERGLGHVVFGSRNWITERISEVAATLPNARVLEIGSGRQDLGTDAYSMRSMFPATCDFVQSDFNPEFGHLVVDITSMEFDQEFDAILCLSVLEHVDRFWEAIPRMHRALRPGGKLILSVPMSFPYHDEPADYWRFTAYGVRLLLREFAEVSIQHKGPRRLPFALFAVAVK